MNRDWHAGTWLAKGGDYLDERDGAVVPPLQPSTTYARDADYALRTGASYGRDGNPTYGHAERVLAGLEGAADALLFASGMAAAAALVATVRPGEHLVAPRVMYHGLRDWLAHRAAHDGLRVGWYDETEDGALEAAIEPGTTRLVWVETPANPTWTVVDLAAAAAAAHAAGARLAVDSTVATPLHTRPIEHGADYVFHSATKMLNGHADVMAGALACRESDAMWDAVRFQRVHAGAVPGSLEAWLLLRGMRTLHLRVERASANALAIARHLARSARIDAVLYPGLQSHPRHGVARRQMRGGFGSMLSIRTGGGAERALEVVRRTRVFVPATSLGGVESLIEHRASVESEGSPVPADLLRLSVGVEHVDDLIADLDQALA